MFYKILKIISGLSLLIFLSCGVNPFDASSEHQVKYKGSVELEKHKWLRNRKIFLDPGHGGKGHSDRFRIGPGGITEEEVNLKVSLILENMLRSAGADVMMSRRSDTDVHLDDRVDMVKSYNPDLLISLHHNGSPRRMDRVNYPSVLIWGSRDVRPASYDFARYLQDEFHRIMDSRGRILSDFSIFRETGTRILRETRYVCPGVIGEGGFFSDEKHELRLKDGLYNVREAEAYFTAISRYFKLGCPTAEVHFSCPAYNNGYLVNMIKDKNPRIYIKVKGDTKKPGVEQRSLKITLDDVPVTSKRISGDLYLVNYGKELYPGGHMLRFSFRNRRHHSSMVLNSCFTMEIKKGDYDRLVKKGCRLVRKRSSAREGVKMLQAALSMGLTDPGADKIIYNLSRGFVMMGLIPQAEYYRKSLYYFYPGSSYGRKYGRSIKRHNDYRYPVKYNGKSAKIIFDSDRCKGKTVFL